MSHFSMLVILPPDTNPDNLDTRLTDILKPYDENDEWFREGSRWDWWAIGAGTKTGSKNNGTL